MAEADNTKQHPEVVRRKSSPIWPEDKLFPLTPLEAWYVLQGREVKPAGGITLDQISELPGKIEGGKGWVSLWQQ
jgi:hypothetical protein